MHLPGSDEEEVKGMLGSLMESPREKETCPNQGLPKTTVSKKELGKPLLVRFLFVHFKNYFY
jgi:hypothetical protein